jgi:hypothetical protein
MSDRATIDPTTLRDRLIDFARQRIVVAIEFTGSRGARCVVIGRPVVIQQDHAVVSLGPQGDTNVIALCRIVGLERLSGRRRDDDRREVEPAADEHRASGRLP